VFTLQPSTIAQVLLWRSSLGFVLLCLLFPFDALSQPLIEEEQRLNFGTLAVAANISVSRFTYTRTGSNANMEGQFVLIARGTPGRYRFSGFPAFTTLNFSLNTSTLEANGVGVSETLLVDNYDFVSVNTDAQGEAEISLGARLSTTGNNNTYADALYSGITVLRVDYWQPDLQAFVFNTRTIDIDAELRSTITLNEEKSLNFGTLAARSSTTDQAVLSLSPTGTFSISEPGTTRLVSLIRPNTGVIRVVGAAPTYSLNITPQAADVLLEHSENPGSAPHFILSALATSPDGSGTVDANGELLITIGGELRTEITTTPTTYPTGRYEGTYQLTVSY